MVRPVAYEGSEPYIFISYAHKDSDRVLPIISDLQAQGFRVWYDAGIEAGTEWPEYIAEHLESCAVFLAFLSQSALDSPNCRREINFAIDERKEMLNIYLEELRLSAGMRMQLGVLQAMFCYRHNSRESFVEELCRSRILSPCRGAAEPTVREPEIIAAVFPVREPELEAIDALFEYEQTDDGGIEIFELKDQTRTAVEIPWGVTCIGSFAFYECKKLTTITIPDSVTSIDGVAFDRCENLISITIPDSVTSIGRGAFQYCRNLTSITIPDSVTSIGDDAFIFCDKLTIRGKRGSVAERYAAENKIPFRVI